MTDRFKVSNILARRLGEHQASLPALLQRAGLPPGFFTQEKICVTTSELFSLWRAIGQTSGDPGIGLKLGANRGLSATNLLQLPPFAAGPSAIPCKALPVKNN